MLFTAIPMPIWMYCRVDVAVLYVKLHFENGIKLLIDRACDIRVSFIHIGDGSLSQVYRESPTKMRLLQTIDIQNNLPERLRSK
jgi:hypothetical protein